MSTSPWPPQQPGQQSPQQQSPWASQDPNWQTPTFRDAPARDPRQPFGTQQPHYQPTINELIAPPKKNSNLPAFIILGLVCLVITVIFALQFGSSVDKSTDDPASTAPRISYDPSAVKTNSNIAYLEQPNKGTFEILHSSWDGDLLTIKFRITLESGSATPVLSAYHNETLQAVKSEEESFGEVLPDKPIEATAHFRTPRGDTTIVMFPDYPGLGKGAGILVRG